MAKAAAVYTLVQRPKDGGIVFSDLPYYTKTARRKTVLLNSRTTRNGTEIFDIEYRKGVAWTEKSITDMSVSMLRVATFEAPLRINFPRGTRIEDREIFIQEFAAYLISQAQSIAMGLMEPGATVSVPNGTQDA